MHADYWFQCWENNDIGFHEQQVNPLLVQHIEKLALTAGDRIFLPLCGKTSSIPWLLGKGFRVVGIELSKIAVDQLFVQLGITPKIDETEALFHYRSDNLDIFLGDFFDLSPELLGHIDGVYDRGSLVALPKAMRDDYANHLQQLAQGAPQLLIGYEYDQTLMEGPPFSVVGDELNQRYGQNYQLDRVSSEQFTPLCSGRLMVYETAWHLHSNSNN